jgi:hypothetical protein
MLHQTMSGVHEITPSIAEVFTRKPEPIIETTSVTDVSPSGKYKIVIVNKKSDGIHVLNHTLITRVCDDTGIYSCVYAVTNPGGIDYQFFNRRGVEWLRISDYFIRNHTFINLDTQDVVTDIHTDFYWKKMDITSDGATLIVTCYIHKCPHEVKFYDFTNPSTGCSELEIQSLITKDPSWNICEHNDTDQHLSEYNDSSDDDDDTNYYNFAYDHMQSNEDLTITFYSQKVITSKISDLTSHQVNFDNKVSIDSLHDMEHRKVIRRCRRVGNMIIPETNFDKNAYLAKVTAAIEKVKARRLRHAEDQLKTYHINSHSFWNTDNILKSWYNNQVNPGVWKIHNKLTSQLHYPDDTYLEIDCRETKSGNDCLEHVSRLLSLHSKDIKLRNKILDFTLFTPKGGIQTHKIDVILTFSSKSVNGTPIHVSNMNITIPFTNAAMVDEVKHTHDIEHSDDSDLIYVTLY